MFFSLCFCWIVGFLTQMLWERDLEGLLSCAVGMSISVCQVPGWSLAALVCLICNPLTLIMVLVAQTQSEKILFSPQQAGMVCKFVLTIQNL